MDLEETHRTYWNSHPETIVDIYDYKLDPDVKLNVLITALDLTKNISVNSRIDGNREEDKTLWKRKENIPHQIVTKNNVILQQTETNCYTLQDDDLVKKRIAKIREVEFFEFIKRRILKVMLTRLPIHLNTIQTIINDKPFQTRIRKIKNSEYFEWIETRILKVMLTRLPRQLNTMKISTNDQTFQRRILKVLLTRLPGELNEKFQTRIMKNNETKKFEYIERRILKVMLTRLPSQLNTMKIKISTNDKIFKKIIGKNKEAKYFDCIQKRILKVMLTRLPLQLNNIKNTTKDEPIEKQENKIDEKPYKCNTCDKSYSEQSRLTIHSKVHTGDRFVNCNFCEKVFVNMACLEVHMATHTAEKVFKCTICDKYFFYSSSLKIHLKNHTGEKIYKCKLCVKSFSELVDLRLHEKIHTVENHTRVRHVTSLCSK